MQVREGSTVSTKVKEGALTALVIHLGIIPWCVLNSYLKLREEPMLRSNRWTVKVLFSSRWGCMSPPRGGRAGPMRGVRAGVLVPLAGEGGEGGNHLELVLGAGVGGPVLGFGVEHG